MTLADGLVALACAVVTAGLSVPVLRRLPEPSADPDAATKTPYADLATPGFAAAVFVGCLVASLLVVGATPREHWLAWAALAGIAVLSAAIDLRTTYLPRVLAVAGWSVTAAGVAGAAVAAGSAAPVLAACSGALALGGFFWLFWRVSGGLGFGDVRLAATIGAVTALESAEMTIWSALLGTTLGAVWSVGRRRASGRDAPFAYGPSLVAGPFLALAMALLSR